MKKKLLAFKNWFQYKNKPVSDEEITCKNCGYEFKGNYCPKCGQSVKEIDQAFGFVFYDFVGTMFAFDSRFFRSLFTLISKPGKITSDFLAGKRVKYMPPFRFYIFISFIFFLVTSSYVKQNVSEIDSKAKLDSLEVNLKHQKELTMDSLQNNLIENNIVVNTNAVDSTFHLDSLHQISEELIRDIKGDSSLSDFFDNKLVSQYKKAKEYPELYITKYFQFFSWSLFLLMPVFALFLKMLYARKKLNYIRHFIFAVNFHAYMFFILSVIVLFHMIFNGSNVNYINYLALIVPVYLVMGMKRFYQQKTGKTIFKAIILSASYNLVILAALFVIAWYAFVNF